MSEGWISIHRKIQDCDIWTNEEPFDRRSAWIDILLSANHREKDIIFDGHKVRVMRGQFLTSVRKLSERWRWSKDRTLRYLRLLEDLEMIERESNARRTLITIVKYEEYQNVRDTDKDTDKDSLEDTDKDSLEDTDKPQTININKTINKYNVELCMKIVAYLNQKCGTNYKASTANTKKHISARLNDGYTYEDFVKVIDKKCNEWKGTQMEHYLRPDTLFGTNFEGYLNQNIVKNKPVTSQFHQMEKNNYDFDDLEKRLLGE